MRHLGPLRQRHAFAGRAVLSSGAPSPAEHLLAPGDPEFAATGLKGPSLVRLDKLAILQRSLLQRRLGHIGPRTDSAVARCLRYVFEL